MLDVAEDLRTLWSYLPLLNDMQQQSHTLKHPRARCKLFTGHANKFIQCLIHLFHMPTWLSSHCAGHSLTVRTFASQKSKEVLLKRLASEGWRQEEIRAIF